MRIPLILGLLFAGACAAAEPIQPDFLVNREPKERPRPIDWVLPPALLPLWQRALEQHDADLKRQIASVISDIARKGHDSSSLIPALRTVLADRDLHPAARHAAAATLIQLNDRDSATLLMETAARDGKDLRLIVEPALGRWKFPGLLVEWRSRLANTSTQRRELLLAIEGVARLQDTTAVESLLNLALSAEAPADLRLAAARSAGEITREGLEPKARSLFARRVRRITEYLCGTALLAHHRSPAAIELHQQLGRDAEPTVAAASLRSLAAIDFQLILPLAEDALKSADVNLRRVAVDCYVTLPTPERVQTLSLRLNDPNPALRAFVRESFRSLTGKPELDAVIRKSSRMILDGDDWRGQEQAALLLGALDQKDCAPRLVTLLESPRPEAFVAAAWALKTLALAETAAPVLQFLKGRTDPKSITTRTDAQDAHLMELLGVLKYEPAVPLMVDYIPKNAPYGGTARASAVWALGLIFEGRLQESLSDQLMDRFMDFRSSPPELIGVRRAAVLTLARMGAKKHLPGMKEVLGPTVDNDFLELTLRSAIYQITGELLPIKVDPPVEVTGWVLEPIPDVKP